MEKKCKEFYCIMCEEYFTVKTTSNSAACPSCHSAEETVPKGHRNYPKDK